MNDLIPVNLFGYYHQNKTEFEERADKKKKTIYLIVVLAFALLLVVPELFRLPALVTRIIAFIGLAISALVFFFGGKDYYNKKSGGKITEVVIKKFDLTALSEAAIVSMFASNDFAGLSVARTADNQPIQLYIHEDTVGKTFYCQLMKYYSPSDFRGLTAVKVISAPAYSTLYQTIKGIAATR